MVDERFTIRDNRTIAAFCYLSLLCGSYLLGGNIIMTLHTGQQRNGRMQPNNPAMYPQWAQRMTRRMMQLATRPNEYIIVFTVHEDGRKEMDIMQATRPPEQLGQ